MIGVENGKKNNMICIACSKWYNNQTDESGKPLKTGGAHVVSKGAGGNQTIDLCYDCHMNIVHQKGWNALFKKYPHMRKIVENIREAEYGNNK